MQKLRAALIGCERIGTKKHKEALAANSDLIDQVAVCDLIPEKAQKASEEYKRLCVSCAVCCGRKAPTTNNDQRIPTLITDYSELYDSDVDFITIATESGNHYRNTTDLLTAGKHVLVEKPMALSTDHMNEMIRVTREKNLKLGV